MFLIISTLLGIGAIVLSFFSTVAAWSLLSVLTVGFWFLLLAIRRKKYPHIDELSDEANALIQRYGHFYFMPFAGSDCSGACSIIGLASIVAAVISCFRGDWWSIVAGVAIYCATSFAARGFNPTSFLSAIERISHDEIAAWLRASANERKG